MVVEVFTVVVMPISRVDVDRVGDDADGRENATTSYSAGCAVLFSTTLQTGSKLVTVANRGFLPAKMNTKRTLDSSFERFSLIRRGIMRTTDIGRRH